MSDCTAFSHLSSLSLHPSSCALMTRSILSSCGFRFLLFLVPGLKVMAKPLQTDLIIAPSNYIGSEFDLDDA